MSDTGNLKEALHDVLGVLTDCPDDLRTTAFEILLQHRLTGRPVSGRSAGEAASIEVPRDSEVAEALGRGTDVQLSDLHVKARRLIETSGMSIDQLNQLFYKENGHIEPLYDDLGSSQMAESQIRLALLEALQNAIVDGDFTFDIESVRAKCRTFKCYDSPNYIRNFRNSADLFDGFEKGAPAVKLSTEGRRRLAEIVTELARSP